MRTGIALAARLAAGLCALGLLSACGNGGGSPAPVTSLTLSGSVVDGAGAALPGVAVLLGLNPATTDSAGNFSYSGLQPGTYLISLQNPGSDFDCRQVSLSAGSTHFDFRLPSAAGGFRASSVTPALNSSGVPLDHSLVVSFSAPLNAGSVSSADFTITPNIGLLNLGVSGAQLTLQPRLQLPLNQYVLVEFTGSIASSTGQAFSGPLRWRFRSAASDTFPPALVSTDPADGTSGYPPNLPVSFEFSEPLGAVDAALSLSVYPAADVTARIAGRAVYVDAAGGWALNTGYTLTISGVPDAAGNRESVPLTLHFTTGATLAPYHDRQPCWNRALDVIVFCSDRLGGYDIFSIKPDATELTRLTSEPGDELEPSLSSDGKLLCYQARGPQGDWDVFEREIDPGAPAVAVTAPGVNDYEPQFSRTFSNDIIFVSDRREPAGLYIMNSDGSSPLELDRSFGSEQRQPALHPLLDTQMLFTSGRNGSRDIWRKSVSAVDGSAINQNLTASLLTNEHSAAWSADSSYFVFISDSGGVENLWTAQATGEFARQVTFFDAPVADPELAPLAGDTRCVVSITQANGSSGLALVDLVGGGIVFQLTGESS